MCATVGSVSVTRAGRESTVTAAAALTPACRRTALSAAAEADASAAAVSAPSPELLGKRVTSVRRVETPATLQGQNAMLTLPQKKE